MKINSQLLLLFSIAALPLVAAADSWKDESGHGKGYGRDRHEYKEEYWDGNCKVKRKLKKDGEYKEERKCKAPRYDYYEPEPVYVPAPGVTIQGTVRLP